MDSFFWLLDFIIKPTFNFLHYSASQLPSYLTKISNYTYDFLIWFIPLIITNLEAFGAFLKPYIVEAIVFLAKLISLFSEGCIQVFTSFIPYIFNKAYDFGIYLHEQIIWILPIIGSSILTGLAWLSTAVSACIIWLVDAFSWSLINLENFAVWLKPILIQFFVWLYNSIIDLIPIISNFIQTVFVYVDWLFNQVVEIVPTLTTNTAQITVRVGKGINEVIIWIVNSLTWVSPIVLSYIQAAFNFVEPYALTCKEGISWVLSSIPGIGTYLTDAFIQLTIYIIDCMTWFSDFMLKLSPTVLSLIETILTYMGKWIVFNFTWIIWAIEHLLLGIYDSFKFLLEAALPKLKNVPAYVVQLYAEGHISISMTFGGILVLALAVCCGKQVYQRSLNMKCVSCKKEMLITYKKMNGSEGKAIIQCVECYEEVSKHLKKTKRRECIVCLEEKDIKTWTSCCGQALHK